MGNDSLTLMTLAAHAVPGWAASAPVIAGLVAGMIHVLAGPDHLAAVAPIAIDARGRGGKGWRSGLWWGIGHSGGVWALALLALLFREVIPIDLISGWSERLVGVVLIGVGLWALRSAVKTRVHAHEHVHDGHTHKHVHAHSVGVVHASTRAHTGHSHAPLGIGMLHGLAGTSHLVGVLPSLLMPTRSAAVMYVVAYGLGSIAAMTGFAHVVGLLLTGFGAGGQRVYRFMLSGTGLAAIGVGVWWVAGV